LIDTFGPLFSDSICLARLISVHQVAMDPPQITDQGRSDHDHTHAGLAAYRHFTITKGMFDRSNCGFYGSAKIMTAGTCSCTALTTQSKVRPSPGWVDRGISEAMPLVVQLCHR